MIAVLGWLGSSLVVTSLIQRDIYRLRQVNLAASVALFFFNLALGIWSMIALNIVLAAINGYHLLAGGSMPERDVAQSLVEITGQPSPGSSGTIRPGVWMAAVERQRAAACMLR
jgi:hypothetical protein